LLAKRTPGLHHQVRTGGRATDPQHRTAMGQQPLGMRMEDFIEDRVARSL
jgi:hypothetical protein